MKSKLLYILLGILCILLLILANFTNNVTRPKQEYIRIHIRANSNSSQDQNIKYKVKDAVIEWLTPLVASCKSRKEVFTKIEQNIDQIQKVAQNTLKQNGFSYGAKAKFIQEEFPARSYNGQVLQAGIYDAIVLELGEAAGDNWWCLVYPPLCFLGEGEGDIIYRSKILELIEQAKKNKEQEIISI